MNKKQLSERDICTKYITPALERPGWDIATQVREEYSLTNERIIVRGKLRWSHWATNPEGITGDELIEFVNNQLFPRLKKLANTPGIPPHGQVVGSVLADAYNYMKSGTLLRQVINSIQEDVDFNSSTDRHLFNDIYEKILTDLQSAGNAGEYYTPRAVTQFMVDMLDPQRGQTILDPACGTGGFLTCAIEHLNAQVKTADDRKRLQESIHGVEKKPLPHMLAMTNMMLHGIDVPTNILFFEKGGPTKEVWFFEHPYPEGYKSYSRSKPLTIAEFDLEKAWWGGASRRGRKTTEQAWKVSPRISPSATTTWTARIPTRWRSTTATRKS